MRSAIRTSALKASFALITSPIAFSAYAQTVNGTITGTVADTSGAAIPGVTITITNLGTSERKTVTTGREGEYRVSDLIPGRYSETVEGTGFKKFIRQPIVVEVGGALRIDVPMELGSVTESVTVSTGTPLLQVVNPELSQVVNEKTVEEMPLNGRNVANLIALTPGVVAQGGTSGSPGSNQTPGHTNNAGFNNYQISGGMPGQAASLIDGAPVNGLGSNTVTLIVTQDTVNEFRVATSSVSAEYGRFGGGVINYATKSGTNSFHGNAYYYFRNKALNTTPYFTKLTGADKPAFNQNQYGGTIGGRVIRDRAFFFANYEQFKITKGQTFLNTVPTAAERNGDFSADAPIYDPYTSVGTGTNITRTRFTNNQIPANRIDPTAKYIVNLYYPLPNVSLAGGNYATTRTPGAKSKQGTGRLDFNLSDRQHLFGRYSYWNLVDIPLSVYNNLATGSGSDQITHQVVIGDTYQVTPKTTIEARLSYTRGFYDDRPYNVNTNLSQFGPAWATLQNQVTFAMIPSPTITNITGINGITVVSSSYRNIYALNVSAARTFGNHSIKVGADVRLMDLNFISPGSPTGTFTFNPGFTSLNNSTAGTTGNGVASFLLGTAASGSIGTAQAVGQFTRYQAYYIADSWQASRKLTLNASLRYDIPGTYAERKDRATVLLPNLASPLGAVASSVGTITPKGGLALVNSADWGSRGTEQEKYTLFSPRVGASYSPNEKTALRVGYSLVYLPFDVSGGGSASASPINSATTTMVASNPSNNALPQNTLSSPFPAGGVVGTVQQSILQPAGRNQAYLTSLNGLAISGPVPQIRFPYAQQWNANLQQEFLGGAVMQVAYVGNRGTFLPFGSINLNQISDANIGAYGSTLGNTAGNPFAGKLNATGSLNGANTTLGQLLRPFPQFGNVTQTNAKGDSVYHAMQLSVQKRFGEAGTISSNYTWAKVIGNIPGTALTQLETNYAIAGQIQDNTDRRGERAEMNYSARHRFVTSYVAALPFGKNKRFFNHANGFTDRLISGWGVNGIVTFQTGYHLSLTAAANSLSNYGAGTIRPNFVPNATGCNNQKTLQGSAQSRISKWFNTACFAAPGAYSFGNEPRVDNSIQAAGIANYDLSLKKTTAIAEGVAFDFRVETFNLFNRVQFGTPLLVVGTSTFGSVTQAVNDPRQIQLSGRLTF